MKLGSGAFGTVTEEGEYAIKTIRDKYPLSGIREVLFLSECDHPNVIKMINVRITDSIMIVMEKWDMSLRNYLTLYPCPHVDAINRIMRNVLSAIDYLHSLGIIHADIKPDNLLINNAANKLALCDFGASMLNNTQEKSCIVQAKIYRAPEVNVRGNATYSFPIDIWSFGCTLYRLCTGVELFNENVDDDTTIDLSHIFMVYRSTRTFRLDRLNLFDKNKIAETLGGKIAHIVGSNRLNSITKLGIFDILVESLIPNTQLRITAELALARLGEKISEHRQLWFDIEVSEGKYPQLVNLIRNKINVMPSITDEMIIREIAMSIFSNEYDCINSDDDKISRKRISELLAILVTRKKCY